MYLNFFSELSILSSGVFVCLFVFFFKELDFLIQFFSLLLLIIDVNFVSFVFFFNLDLFSGVD